MLNLQQTKASLVETGTVADIMFCGVSVDSWSAALLAQKVGEPSQSFVWTLYITPKVGSVPPEFESIVKHNPLFPALSQSSEVSKLRVASPGLSGIQFVVVG